MTLRRYTPLRKSRGERIPEDVRRYVLARDRGCVGHLKAGFPGPCTFGLELDHVRASGGLGMKSPSTPDNLVALCPLAHRLKTHDGRKYRPALLEYLARVEP